MAFCTNCGAQTSGAFCAQCGTPSKTGSGPAAGPPPAAAPYNAPAGVGTAPRKTSPIVWILVSVACIVVLGFIVVAGTTFFLVRKVSRNPGLAMAKLVTTFNPDAEVLKTDEDAGTITVRDRKTGQVVTMNFDDVRKGGRIRFSARDEAGKTATMEIGSSDSKMPSWVPNYPGTNAKPQLTIKGNSNDEGEEAGSVTFTTSDAPAKVMDFYQDKIREAGMKVNLTTHTGEGGMLVAADEANHRGLTVIVTQSGSEGTGVNLTYTNKR